MNVLWLLFRKNGQNMWGSVFLGLVSGAAGTALIAVANSALYSGTGARRAAWLLGLAFAAAAIAKIASSLASGVLLARGTQEIMLTMCKDLCRRVAATSLPKLEKIGTSRVMACLTDDIDIVSSAMNTIPTLLVDLAMLVGCAIYLAWISWIAASILVILVILVTVTYRSLLAKAHFAVRLVRDGRDKMLRHFRSLVEGIKEIQLHNDRKRAFLEEEIDGTAQFIRKHNIISMNRYALAEGWCHVMYFSLLGIVLFAFPMLHHITLKTLTAYVFVALYMMGPLLGIVSTVPFFLRGKASLDRLQEMGLALTDIDDVSVGALQIHADIAGTGNPPLIELQNVVFRHGDECNGNAFTLGPVNLTLYPGELVFVIGGNGSGKSTLAKVVAGLYPPESGRILVDGHSVSESSENAYRQLFSAVFSDFFLFDRVLGLDRSNEWKQRTNEYLVALDLAHKVEMNGTSFSTISLSQGQRRRLALLVTYLEDRPIYILDEWAADQDPVFRQIFYLKLLPELKERGKTVVLITHDDRYFHLGDRVVKLDYGKVVEIQQKTLRTESFQA